MRARGDLDGNDVKKCVFDIWPRGRFALFLGFLRGFSRSRALCFQGYIKIFKKLCEKVLTPGGGEGRSPIAAVTWTSRENRSELFEIRIGSQENITPKKSSNICPRADDLISTSRSAVAWFHFRGPDSALLDNKVCSWRQIAGPLRLVRICARRRVGPGMTGAI